MQKQKYIRIILIVTEAKIGQAAKRIDKAQGAKYSCAEAQSENIGDHSLL